MFTRSILADSSLLIIASAIFPSVVSPVIFVNPMKSSLASPETKQFSFML